MLLRGARLMLFLPEMTFDVQLMTTKLDSNAIRLIFKSLVTWLVSKPYFFSKSLNEASALAVRLLRFVSLSLKVASLSRNRVFKSLGWKEFFFPEGKQLWERHVNYPQLYVSSCFCSLSHSMPMKRGAFGTIVVTLPILFTCRLVLCTWREA